MAAGLHVKSRPHSVEVDKKSPSTFCRLRRQCGRDLTQLMPSWCLAACGRCVHVCCSASTVQDDPVHLLLIRRCLRLRSIMDMRPVSHLVNRVHRNDTICLKDGRDDKPSCSEPVVGLIYLHRVY